MAREGQEADSKQRLIASAERLLRRQGYTGTGVDAIAREGTAPMGSFYHHFPGGKEQLAAAALDAGADAYAGLISRALGGEGDLADRLARIATTTADSLAGHDYALGCPVATTALETVTTSAVLQERSRAALEHWTGLISHAARDSGVDADQADTLATTTIALIEGAELMARVHRSRHPLAVAAQALRTLANDHSNSQEPRPSTSGPWSPQSGPAPS